MKLKIKVIPSSSKEGIAGWLGDTLKIKVKAAPEKGKANKAVIKIMESELDLTKGSVQITRGHTSPIKFIEITINNNTLPNDKLLKIIKNR